MLSTVLQTDVQKTTVWELSRLRKSGWSRIYFLISSLLLIISIVVPTVSASQYQQPQRIWIDADPACGHSFLSDVDDCLAIAAVLSAPGINVVGISTVFGNESVHVTDRVTRNLVHRMSSGSIAAMPVYKGARSRWPEPSQASIAIAQALEAGPLTVLALGPLTNLSMALHERPDLASRLTNVIAVMGKRPGQIFRPAEGSSSNLLGAGIVFSDFNLRKDPEAAQHVLNSHVPMTLIPYELSRQVEIDSAGLRQLAAVSSIGSWLAGQAKKWLMFWNGVIGRNGFYPFDLVAAAYLLEPQQFVCHRQLAAVERDKPWHRMGIGPQSLLVLNSAAFTGQPSSVRYCSRFRNPDSFNPANLLSY